MASWARSIDESRSIRKIYKGVPTGTTAQNTMTTVETFFGERSVWTRTRTAQERMNVTDVARKYS